jgi:hypothetical protein
MRGRIALILAASVGLLGSVPARADDLLAGLELSRPALACKDHERDLRVPGLWLGHFTGGRLIHAPAGGGRLLDWRDDYACFPTGAACARWEAGLLRVYHSQQGYRTCLPLRGGGERIRVVKRLRVHHRRHAVIRAKY